MVPFSVPFLKERTLDTKMIFNERSPDGSPKQGTKQGGFTVTKIFHIDTAIYW
jgi:hypothetical protein